jgi:capsular polysaccharide transport system permease protein
VTISLPQQPFHISFAAAVRRKWYVMRAVMLRDMRTRFFDHGLGFLVVVLWPLSHLAILLMIYAMAGRTAPYGDNLEIFFATGLVPTLSFVYVSRFMALSLVMHRSMLAFPVVQPSDILFGRALLEILASCAMAFLTIALLAVLGDNPMPADMVAAASAFCAILLLAVGVGILVGVIGAIFPFFVTIYSLSIILVYILSGTLFVVSALPAKISYALSWNPVLHGVEWMRTAYFIGYPDQILDIDYLIGFALGAIFLGLLLERLLRPWVLESA